MQNIIATCRCIQTSQSYCLPHRHQRKRDMVAEKLRARAEIKLAEGILVEEVNDLTQK